MSFGIMISPTTQRDPPLAYKSPLVNPYGLGELYKADFSFKVITIQPTMANNNMNETRINKIA
jgi:hypothetical protein